MTESLTQATPLRWEAIYTICWRSRKQRVTATSTVEAEYLALSAAAKHGEYCTLHRMRCTNDDDDDDDEMMSRDLNIRLLVILNSLANRV